jgi:hypothetical protein
VFRSLPHFLDYLIIQILFFHLTDSTIRIACHHRHSRFQSLFVDHSSVIGIPAMG